MPTETETTSLIPSRGKLFAALAKAQAEFKPVSKDKEVTVQTRTGGNYKFKFAPLDSVLSAVLPALNKNGIAFVQIKRGTHLLTMLCHESGESIESEVFVPDNEDPQQYGKYLTFMRRYEAQNITGVAAEEDNDANDHESTQTKSFEARPVPPRDAKPSFKPGEIKHPPRPAPPTPAQVKLIQDLLKQLNLKTSIPTDATVATSLIMELNKKIKQRDEAGLAAKMNKAQTPIEADPSYTTDDIPF